MGTQFLSDVRAALGPLILEGIVGDVREVGFAGYNDHRLSPAIAITVLDEHPIIHADEISRLMLASGLRHVNWTIAPER